MTPRLQLQHLPAPRRRNWGPLVLVAVLFTAAAALAALLISQGGLP